MGRDLGGEKLPDRERRHQQADQYRLVPEGANADGDGDNETGGQVDARLDAAIEAIKEAIEEYKLLVAGKDSVVPPINIKLEGVGHFKNEVIFANPNFVEKDNLKIS